MQELIIKVGLHAHPPLIRIFLTTILIGFYLSPRRIITSILPILGNKPSPDWKFLKLLVALLERYFYLEEAEAYYIKGRMELQWVDLLSNTKVNIN